MSMNNLFSMVLQFLKTSCTTPAKLTYSFQIQACIIINLSFLQFQMSEGNRTYCLVHNSRATPIACDPLEELQQPLKKVTWQSNCNKVSININSVFPSEKMVAEKLPLTLAIICICIDSEMDISSLCAKQSRNKQPYLLQSVIVRIISVKHYSHYLGSQ